MPFLVVYDDQCSLCLPMGKDVECDGAICVAGGSDAVTLFESAPAAKKAIKISRLFAQLREAQGETPNDDFLTGYRNVRIRKVESA